MNENGKSGTEGQTELKVFEGSEGLHGAAVNMDSTTSVGPGDTAADSQSASLADGNTRSADGKASGMDGEASARADGEASARADGDTGSADGKVSGMDGDGVVRPEHKKQLRERIEARRQELETALSQLEANQGTAPQEMVLAIQTSLQALDAHIGGGWDCVGAVEAQQLAQWLESVQHLGEVTPQDGAARKDGAVNEAAAGGSGVAGQGEKSPAGTSWPQDATGPRDVGTSQPHVHGAPAR